MSSGAGDETRKYTREDELRALGKHLLNMQMTDEERGLVTVAGKWRIITRRIC